MWVNEQDEISHDIGWYRNTVDKKTACGRISLGEILCAKGNCLLYKDELADSGKFRVVENRSRETGVSIEHVHW